MKVLALKIPGTMLLEAIALLLFADLESIHQIHPTTLAMINRAPAQVYADQH